MGANRTIFHSETGEQLCRPLEWLLALQLCLLLLLRERLLFLFMFFQSGNKLGSRILDKIGRHTSVENSPSGAEISCRRLKAVISNASGLAQ